MDLTAALTSEVVSGGAASSAGVVGSLAGIVEGAVRGVLGAACGAAVASATTRAEIMAYPLPPSRPFRLPGRFGQVGGQHIEAPAQSVALLLGEIPAQTALAPRLHGRRERDA